MIETKIEDLANLTGAPDADAIVVIDVLRAFSTAAVALDRGAVEIYPVLEVQEAFDRRNDQPDFVLMGERDCLPVDGFDLGNSPVAAAEFPFRSRRVVQRTTAGTRGLVCCASAPLLWAASFLVAPATVVALQASGAKRVAFIVTGTVHYNSADEDLACAEWMGKLLQGKPTPVDPYLQRVRDSVAAATFLEPGSPLYAPADVDFCARAGVFPFSLKAETVDKVLVLGSVRTEQGIGRPGVQGPL